MSVDSNVALVERFLQASAACRGEEIADLITQDFAWSVMMSGSRSRILDRQAYLKMTSSLPGIIEGAVVMTTTGWTAQDDRVAVEAESKATVNGGRVYNNFYHFLFTISDGKLSSGREYMDSLHAEETFRT